MKIVSPSAAVAALDGVGTVAFPGACADPTRFHQAFSADVERFHGLTVVSGLSLGSYAFLARGLGEHFHYLTWQAAPALRPLFKEGDRRKLSFVPLRLSDVTQVVRRDGPIAIDAVVVQTSPPLADGTVSLGLSLGANRHFIEQARLVIAEFNSNMPVTGGAARVPLAAIDVAPESDEPLATSVTGEPDERTLRIVDHVLGLIPENAWVQPGSAPCPTGARALG